MLPENVKIHRLTESFRKFRTHLNFFQLCTFFWYIQGRTYWFWLGGCNHEMRPTHHWNVNPDRLLVSWCVAIKLGTKHGNSCHLLGILQEYTYSLLWDIIFLLSVRALSAISCNWFGALARTFVIGPGSHFLRHYRARILLHMERTTVCHWTWVFLF
jgi:hypothetical protein